MCLHLKSLSRARRKWDHDILTRECYSKASMNEYAEYDKVVDSSREMLARDGASNAQLSIHSCPECALTASRIGASTEIQHLSSAELSHIPLCGALWPPERQRLWDLPDHLLARAHVCFTYHELVRLCRMFTLHTCLTNSTAI